MTAARHDQTKSTKGAKTERAILNAAVKLIAEKGMSVASQERIAKAAGISQSALRHYFPTRKALISAIFEDAYRTYRADTEVVLLHPFSDPKERLRELVSAHLSTVKDNPDSFIFEAHAHFARNPEDRKQRTDWYNWLLQQYVGLILQSNPGMERTTAEIKSRSMLTLVLGCWLTLSRSSSLVDEKQREEAFRCILDQVLAIAFS